VAAVKLAGFLVLLAVIFVCAHVIGGRAGPLTAGHSTAQYTGETSGTWAATTSPSPDQNTGDMPGMDMGGQP